MDVSRQHLSQDASRWLVISEEAFVPTDSGGRAETLAMLRSILAAGIDLHVLVPGISDECVRTHREATPGATVEHIARRYGLRAHLSFAPYVVASRPAPRSLVRSLRDAHARRPFTAVVALTFRVAHIGELAASTLGLPLLVRPHNIESSYFADLARSSTGVRRLAYRTEAARLRRAERTTHRSQVITMFADISDSDARRRQSETAIPVHYEPPFLPTRPTSSETAVAPTNPDMPPTLLFIGSMDNANNRSAVRWFVERCWPMVRGRADLRVVGRRFPDDLQAWLVGRGVDVIADAPSLDRHLSACTLFVNPMQRGSGVNIKIIDAVTAGLPVVTTSAGARGLPWRDDEHLLIRDEATQFAEAVNILLDDTGRRRAMARRGHDFIIEHLSPTRRITDLQIALECRPSGPGATVAGVRGTTDLPGGLS